MLRKLLLLLSIAMFSTASLSARSFRVQQIPNGQKNRCLNCHVGTSGGDRNVFGETIENEFLDQDGNVIWNEVLAARDTDGDGFSNGTELQDPDGTWGLGDDNPGNIDLVTLPGDDGDFPSSVFDFSSISSVNLSISAAPNPIFSHTAISFSLQNMMKTSVALYDAEGNLVVQLANQAFASGSHTLDWNATNMYGEIVSSGTYYLIITSGKYRDSKRIVVTR